MERRSQAVMNRRRCSLASGGCATKGNTTSRYWDVAWEVGEWCGRLGWLGRGIGDVRGGFLIPTAASLLMHLSSLLLECNGSPWLTQESKIGNRSRTHECCPRATAITEFYIGTNNPKIFCIPGHTFRDCIIVELAN